MKIGLDNKKLNKSDFYFKFEKKLNKKVLSIITDFVANDVNLIF
jgi:hypothetical protein